MSQHPVRATTEVEVRYAETDQMGVVHHANYLVWFELARTRLCTLSGFHYQEIEDLGYHLMVTSCQVDYRRGARYGDTLAIARKMFSMRPGCWRCHSDSISLMA